MKSFEGALEVKYTELLLNNYVFRLVLHISKFDLAPQPVFYGVSCCGDQQQETC